MNFHHTCRLVDVSQVVGYEGVLGVIALAILLTIVQFLPGKDGEGIHEDTIESFHMVRMLSETAMQCSAR